MNICVKNNKINKRLKIISYHISTIDAKAEADYAKVDNNVGIGAENDSQLDEKQGIVVGVVGIAWP